MKGRVPFAVLVMRFRRSASELDNSADVLIGAEPSNLAGIVKFRQSLIAGFRGRLPKIYIATPKVSFIPAQGETLGVGTKQTFSALKARFIGPMKQAFSLQGSMARSTQGGAGACPGLV